MIPFLACDVFFIPATGTRIEPLFNAARDVCHFRRSHLKLVTVEEMILFLCATRVDLRENEVGQLEQVFEIEVVREKWNEYSEGLEINMIGNTE